MAGHSPPATEAGLTGYDSQFILDSMKVGDRGQVAIPKEIRDRFTLGPQTEVEFSVIGDIVYSELCVHFETRREIDRFPESSDIRVQALTREAHFEASRAWRTTISVARTLGPGLNKARPRAIVVFHHD